jgi:branched-chain amino acid transport system permease protein
VVQGILLMLVIIYLPRGLADTIIARMKDRRLRRKAAPAAVSVPTSVPVASIVPARSQP